MNIDIGTIKDGQRPIGKCFIGRGSLGVIVWRMLHVAPNEAERVRHLLVNIRTMPQDYFERMLHELVKLTTDK